MYLARFTQACVWAILIVVAIASIGAAAPASAADVINVGVLLDSEGDVRTDDATIEAAVKLARDDLNERFERIGVPTRVHVIVKDTKTDPQLAVEAVEALARDGVRVVIGPTTSVEVKAVRDVLATYDMVAISPSSTAPSLALQDHVFRFVTDDTRQAEALANRYRLDGIEIIIPLYRDGAYGRELVRALKDAVGNALLSGVSYSDSPSPMQLEELAAQVTSAVQAHGKDKVAIQYVGYDELTTVFAQAETSDALSSVRWYAADGVAGSPALVASDQAVAFAQRVDFIATLPYPALRFEKANPVIAALYEQGYTDLPLAYALIAYDALHVAAKAHLYVPEGSSRQLMEAVRAELEWFDGVTGNIELDENGDRTNGNYNYLRLVPGADDKNDTWFFAGRWRIP